MQVIEPILEKIPNAKVLDLGCAYGYVGYNRFTPDKCSVVLGVDRSQACIDYATNKFVDNCHKYAQIDLEDDDAQTKFANICAENNIESFDIIFAALTLHHLKDPLKLLRWIRKYLRPNGVIILRGSDDGAKLCNSNSNLMDTIIQKTYQVEGISDRKNARKMYAWLKNSGFRDIDILAHMRNTAQMTFEQKQAQFQESFSYRINYFKKQWQNDVGNPQKEQDFDEMEILLAQFEEEFYTDSFWYCEFDFYAIAKR